MLGSKNKKKPLVEVELFTFFMNVFAVKR